MNTGGEAAEQIVRMSLEGVEVAVKVAGAGAKNLAVLLYAVLKEEKKTRGKARLTSMLRSGRELKVFSVRNADLSRFTKEAKRYGILYCVLADKENKDPGGVADVIARAEDAPKINRIVERFRLASVDGKADKGGRKEEAAEPPFFAGTGKSPRSALTSGRNRNPMPGASMTEPEKPSVKEEIKKIRDKKKEAGEVFPKEKTSGRKRPRSAVRKPVL